MLTPEQISNCYDKAIERWNRDGKTGIYEFNFLWQYITDEVAKAQEQATLKEVKRDMDELNNRHYPAPRLFFDNDYQAYWEEKLK